MSQFTKNNKAYHDFFIEETVSAGIVLLGTEVKAIISGKANLQGSFVEIDKGEAWLHSMHIGQYDVSSKHNPHDETRKRKLLLTKKQIRDLNTQIQMKGYTLIPLSMETGINSRQNKIKVTIGVAKGKCNYDKRQSIKEKDIKREMSKFK